MNLIGNSCLSSFITKEHIKEGYSNPFCWSVIDINSFCYLIENFDKINFWNYELVKDENWNFYIIIDEKIKVKFIHYKFSKQHSTILRKGLDVFYNKIWTYIVEKYETRLKRMLEKKEEPIFIIGSSYDKSFGAVDENDIKKLSKLKTNYKIIITSDKDINFQLPNNIVYYKHTVNKNNKYLSEKLFNYVGFSNL